MNANARSPSAMSTTRVFNSTSCNNRRVSRSVFKLALESSAFDLALRKSFAAFALAEPPSCEASFSKRSATPEALKNSFNSR